MILESDLAGTVITGEGTGLRVRSLNTPRIVAVCSLEREFASGAEEEASFRRKIEALTAGSLLIAARGTQQPGGDLLEEAVCVDQGQFMSGACAGALRDPISLKEFHKQLAEGPLAEGLPFIGPIRAVAERPIVEAAGEESISLATGPAVQRIPASGGVERIAITGMSVANSLGNGPEEVWQACIGMKSGIIPIPASKWDHDLFYHPRPRMPEKTYCKVGAFMNLEV
jgi:Beta-ketoacyl synthase, N-terminal domain